MPAWVAVLGAVAGLLTSLLISQLLEGPDEAGKPLAALRGEGFDVRMPGSPERSEQPIPLPILGPAKDLIRPTTATTYTSGGDGMAYLVSVMKGPTVVASDLKQALAGMAAAVEGSVRESATTRYRGRPAINARITGAADGRATIFVRIVHARERVFVLQVVVDGEDADTPPPAYADVLASLRIHRAARRAGADRDAIVARKVSIPPPTGVAAGLAECRRQAAGKRVSEGVRRRVRQLCADAAGKDLSSVENATFAACFAVAQETGELERCGLEVVRP